MQWMFEGMVILVMLVVNAIFAAYEMALASVSRARLEALAQLNRRGAHSAIQMKSRLERSLAVVQVGITLAGAIAAATGGAGVDEYLVPVLSRTLGLTDRVAEFLGVTLLVIPLSALTIVFAELVPKMFAIKNKEFVTLALSPVMRGVSYVIYPAIFLLETIVKHIIHQGERKGIVPTALADEKVGLVELRAAASLARSSRLIGALEEQIVHAAARLSVRTVREVMTPISEIATIPQCASLADALIRAHIHMHTRYPTCAEEANPQTITGYVNFKDIIATMKTSPHEAGLRSIIRPIKRIDEYTSLSQALEQMIRENAHIACIVQTGGTLLGLLTLEDVMEELVGDIGDEYDRLPTHIQALTSGWIAGGGVSMREVARVTSIPLAVAPASKETLADWCEAHRGVPLRNGDIVRFDGMECNVRKMRRRRLMEAVIRRHEPQNAGSTT